MHLYRVIVNGKKIRVPSFAQDDESTAVTAGDEFIIGFCVACEVKARDEEEAEYISKIHIANEWAEGGGYFEINRGTAPEITISEVIDLNRMTFFRRKFRRRGYIFYTRP